MPTQTLNAPKIKTALPGPNAKHVLEGDRKYISPSYTRSYPLVAKHGRGIVVPTSTETSFSIFLLASPSRQLAIAIPMWWLRFRSRPAN